jgi:hypothetical protein
MNLFDAAGAPVTAPRRGYDHFSNGLAPTST